MSNSEFVNHSEVKYKDHLSIVNIKNKLNSVDFKLHTISNEYVSKKLQALKSGKATGYDNIPAKLLKAAEPIITPTLTGMINTGITTKNFPSAAKVAEVIPVYKKEDNMTKKIIDLSAF